ncbi:iron chelate uptake ABC transporter family permease subunit [Spirillospora sp. CA-294931]|uniref:iron chelate uptake ABC transporter family permease subunit n=1 Tax=Spirillospora sp. CA-294931 TaxID=3240042 RepID=UPI003D91EE4C
MRSELLWMVSGAMAAQVVATATRLGVMDGFGDRESTAEEMAERCDAEPQAMSRLVRTLAALGLLVESSPGRFAPTAGGSLDFVAFVVPQVALRLTGGSRPPLLASAVYGACLIVAADLVTRVVLPFAVPAGIVTTALGAPYLIWLLYRLNGKGRRQEMRFLFAPGLKRISWCVSRSALLGVIYRQCISGVVGASGESLVLSAIDTRAVRIVP